MKRQPVTSPRGYATLLKNRREQKTRLCENFTFLLPFLTEWFWQRDAMKDAIPYQDAKYRDDRLKRVKYSVLGGPGYGYGELQTMMDLRMNNLLQRLKADIPYMPETDFYAYTYFAAGFNNQMVAYLIGLKSASAAGSIRSRLKDEFIKLNSPNKFEYLELLGGR